MEYKAGDEVWVRGKVTGVDNGDVKIFFAGYGERVFKENDADLASKVYEQGLADAWELAKKIVCVKGGMPYAEIEAIFGSGCTVEDILVYCTADEVLAKVKAYEKEKEKEIKPTDVVEYNGKKWVVTEVYKGEYSIWNGKKVVHTANVKKVGSVESIKPLEELLRQIGGRYHEED